MEANSESNFLKVNPEGESYDLEILLRRPSLRSNVPQKSSQVYSTAIRTRETTCGIACFQGEWLQSFSTRTSFLVIYGALACFYGSFNAYFYGSITTLEKRFHLTSQSIGIIASTGDFVQVITCIVLSFCSIKNHRPRWISVGIFLVFLSALIWSSAHFLCENTKVLLGETQNSTNEARKDVQDNVLHVPLPIVYLSLAQILYGIGGSLFFALGTTYIEDNTKDYQTPPMLNLLLALKTVGLALGYWLSSMCLKIFGTRTHVPDITETNPKWIGAWWFGNLMVAFLVVIPGVLISLYPSSMPKTIVRRLFSGDSKNDETDEPPKVLGTSKNILTSSLHYKNFSGIYNIFRFSVYFIFLTKYVEVQYQIPASKANFTVGTITLLCSAFGTVLVGSLISRYKPGITCLLAWNFTVGTLSIGCFIYYIFLGCPNYESQIKSLILQFVASFQTSEIVYADSVCDEFGQTYLSVGMIGCSNILNINQTIICEGINRNHTDINIMKTLLKGPCPVDCQSQFLKFTFVTCLMSFIYGSGKISNFLIHIKDDDELERSQLLNWGILLNLLTILPVPMLFGHYLDVSCVLWDDSKSETGNCWLYDLEYLRLLFNLSAVGFAIVGIISDALVLLSMRNVKMSYNEVD